jgi:hypothetical protein
VSPSSNVALDEAPGGACGKEDTGAGPKVLVAAAALPEELELDEAPKVLELDEVDACGKEDTGAGPKVLDEAPKVLVAAADGVAAAALPEELELDEAPKVLVAAADGLAAAALPEELELDEASGS